MTKEQKKDDNRNKYPEPVTGALIVNEKGELLLAKGTKWGDQYVIFGGHVELGENVENSVRREALEETGLEVEVVTRLNFGEHIATDGHYHGRHMIFLDFLCLYKGDPSAVKLNDEYSGEYIWVTPEEGLKLDLGGGTKNIIEKYIKYRDTENALTGWKQCLADFENYKKRQSESQKELGGFLIEKLLFDIIPVLDNFRMATSHVPKKELGSPWVTGIGYIEKQLEDALAGHGVSVMEVKEGDAFDPSFHEAVSSEEQAASEESSGKQVIAKVLQNGYKIGDRVVRAAKVTVKSS